MSNQDEDFDEDEIFEANDDYFEYVCPNCGNDLTEDMYGNLICSNCDGDG